MGRISELERLCIGVGQIHMTDETLRSRIIGAIMELQNAREQIKHIIAERDVAIADIKRYGRGCGTCIHKREGKFCSQGGCYSSWANWEYRGLPNTTPETP